MLYIPSIPWCNTFCYTCIETIPVYREPSSSSHITDSRSSRSIAYQTIRSISYYYCIEATK